MSIDSFRIFCDVVSSKSFSRGASANKVSQSAATQTVHRLEKELDASLIDRSKRPFVLTPEGEICYESFREILESYDTLTTRIRALHDQVGGLIRVAAIYSVGIHEMSRVMRAFMKAYPKVNVSLEFLHPHRVYQAVLDSEVDLGVVSYPTTSPEIDVIPLRSEEMAVIVPVGHPLANRSSLAMEDLEGLDYVAFNRELIIRRETDRHMRQRGVNVKINMEFDNIETIKQAIEVGLGVSILPVPTVISDVEAGKMIAIPLLSPTLTRPIGIIYRHRKVFTTTTTRFIEMLTDSQSAGNPGESRSGMSVAEEDSIRASELVSS